jgi:hypothetical protein
MRLAIRAHSPLRESRSDSFIRLFDGLTAGEAMLEDR